MALILGQEFFSFARYIHKPASFTILNILRFASPWGKTAALLKQVLKDDPAWATFLQLASQSKRKIQQTSLAALAPPNQRSKARYMNIDLLINWGGKILSFFDKRIDSQTLFEPKQVEAKLGWILTYRESLAEWQVLVELVTTTESFVRTQGISRDSEIKFLIKLPVAIHKLVE